MYTYINVAQTIGGGISTVSEDEGFGFLHFSVGNETDFESPWQVFLAADFSIVLVSTFCATFALACSLFSAVMISFSAILTASRSNSLSVAVLQLFSSALTPVGLVLIKISTKKSY